MSQTLTQAIRPPGGWIGRLAGLPVGRRSGWTVIAAAAVVLVAIVATSGSLESVERNDAAAYLPANAESLAVSELQERFGRADIQPAVIVYQREGGLTPVDLARIEADRDALAQRFPDTPPEPIARSEDGAAALVTVPLYAPMNTDADEDSVLDDVRAIRELVGAGDDGLAVAVAGQAGFIADLVGTFEGIDLRLLLASALVVTVILVLTYRSPLLWLLPLLTIGVAVMVATAITYWLAEAQWITVTGLSGGLLPIFAFGVGTDYALLITARYREELRRHAHPREAMAVALRRAAPAIFASSGTGIAGLLCLLAADVGGTRGVGPVGALALASALVTMLTLFPALVVLFGRRLFWPLPPRAAASDDTGGGAPRGAWARIGRVLQRRPRPVWVVAVLVLAVLAAGAAGLDTRLAQADQFVDEPEAVRGQRVIAEHYAAGAGAPATVIVSGTAAAGVEAAARSTPGIAAVDPAGQADGMTAFSVTLDADPLSDEAFDAIDRLRETLGSIPGAAALVGGPDAEQRDVAAAAARDRLVIVPLVLTAVLVLLVLLLRSIVAPLLLVGSVALSFGAALGAGVLLFEHVLGFAAVEPSIPILGFVFLVALGVDYNIFLMTRVREEAQTHGPREGVVRGLAATGGVITSAGLVLAATFSVLTLMPLVMMVQIGVIVALGVLLDAFLVRTLVVPALALDLGARIWWPAHRAVAGE